MPVTIKVNGLFNSLVHKGSNGISMATIPDVCKTPSPAGPIPIPYPNISQSAMLAKGTTTVKADGGMMIATKGSEFSLSNGDEPGVAGGVVSGVNMKESTWILYSFDVKMDGQNACRFMDKKFQNHQNTVDMGGILQAPVMVLLKLIAQIKTKLAEIIAAKKAASKSCTITSQTRATSPANRTRRTIGIGEDVDLTVSPGPATWNIASGSGTISAASGTTVTLTAPDRATTVTIQATGAGCTCSITFEVIEPTGLLFEKASNFKHTIRRPDCGYLAKVYVQPDTVSFHNIEIRELNSAAALTGFYDIPAWRGITHQPKNQAHSNWLTIEQPIAGKGSPGIGWKDQIYSGDPGGPITNGTLTFPITWEYHVGSGAEKAFPSFTQVAQVDGVTGQCTQSKDGESKSRVPSDATSNW